MKNITLLGSTGSIGVQTLNIVRRFPNEYKITALSCGHNIKLFREQLLEFKPLFAAVAEEKDLTELSIDFPNIQFAYGLKGICEAASLKEADIVVNALLGMMGIKPTLAAIEAKKDVAFANKETLVAGGDLITDAVKRNKVAFLPVDSEHSAIFQCLNGNASNEIKKILLTASGGPFRSYSYEDLRYVKKEDALKHPNWKMGAKITIDSATMMNKGLEVIEAARLFSVPYDKIEVLVHKESIVHSAVEFMDGAVIAQMGVPDMAIPIAYALSYPKRFENISESLDLFKVKNLSFEKPNLEVFKCLKLAFEAMKLDGSYTICLNAANEEAVKAFLNDEISFLQIGDVVEDSLNKHIKTEIKTVDDIFEVEAISRETVRSFIGGIK